MSKYFQIEFLLNADAANMECTSKFAYICILCFLLLTIKHIVPVLDICDLIALLKHYQIEFLLNDDSASWRNN